MGTFQCVLSVQFYPYPGRVWVRVLPVTFMPYTFTVYPHLYLYHQPFYPYIYPYKV